MKLRIQLASIKRGLGWAQAASFLVSLILLGYCGFVLMDAKLFQQSEHAVLRKERINLEANPVWQDGTMGRIEIPRLGISAVIVEGTSYTALRRAVGHIEGTDWPGRPGNIGLSAHRDTFFRPLRNIRKNDVISLTNAEVGFRYRVVDTKIVKPNDVAVLEPNGQEILTLVTCYPFYFIGPAPNRFIVRAERIDERKLQPSECLSCFSDLLHDSLQSRVKATDASKIALSRPVQ